MLMGEMGSEKHTIMLAGGFTQDLVIAEGVEEDGLQSWVELAERVGPVLATNEKRDGGEILD